MVSFEKYLTIPKVVDLKATEKIEAIRELADALCRKLLIRKRKPIIDELLRREQSTSSFISQGVAIPKAPASIKPSFAIAVGRSMMGFDYDAPGGNFVHFIVLVLVKDPADRNQIQLMTEIATYFKSEIVQETLLGSGEPPEILSVSEMFEGATQKDSRDDRSQEDSVSITVFKSMLELAKAIKAKAIVVFADAVRENDFLDHIKTREKLIVVTSNKSRFDSDDKRIDACIEAPSFRASRTGQIKIGILLALSRDLIKPEDNVVCLSGNPGNGSFDTILALDIEKEYEFFLTTTHSILPADIKPEVLERVLGLAAELSVEGREGKPTGAMFVIGDTNTVNQQVRQLIMNPFRGYSETERNILDPALTETIKEFCSMDGAFIITGDGILLSAGSYLRPIAEIDLLPGGLGARHAAAAGITASTKSLAVTVSESTGMVTLFKSGRILMTLSKPLARDRGMVQKIIDS